jgi:hypothetical protein
MTKELSKKAFFIDKFNLGMWWFILESDPPEYDDTFETGVVNWGFNLEDKPKLTTRTWDEVKKNK